VERITEAGDKHLNLLRLGQGGVATGEGDEALGVVIHYACAPQHGEFTNGAVIERRPEARIHELHELGPCRPPAVKLHAVKSQLGVIQQVEGGEHDPLVLWCTVYVEVMLVAVEPGQGITGAVKFRELELVGRRREVATDRVVIVTALPLTWLRSSPALDTLRVH
jgi:hypothetical protein